MKVTKTEEHGLRLAMTMAREGGQLPITELARREGLSEALVAKLLGMLRRAGVVRAERGRKGGYELAGPPETIPVGRVIEALGPPLFRGCLEKGAALAHAVCSHSQECGLRAVWALLEERIERYLAQVSLADLIEPEAALKERLERLWPAGPSAPARGGVVGPGAAP